MRLPLWAGTSTTTADDDDDDDEDEVVDDDDDANDGPRRMNARRHLSQTLRDDLYVSV